MTGQYGAPVLAIDIGGTKMMTAVISADGKILASDVYPTAAGEGVTSVIERLGAGIDNLLNDNSLEPSQLSGIGVACAGGIDTARGMVSNSPNLPGWVDIPLVEIIQKKYRVSTFLLNDASAAALGEHRFGAGRGVDNLVLFTLGTGIGGGIIIDGRLYLGTSGAAGEIGHMTIDVNGPECACGNSGCLEVLSSGTAISREAIKRVSQGEESALTAMVNGKIEDIKVETVETAARKGDPLAMDVLARAAGYFGVGLVNVVNIFNPEMIVIGGGMASLGDLFIEPARRVVAERAFPVSARVVRIIMAQLGNEAGVYGAAAFALEAGARRTV